MLANPVCRQGRDPEGDRAPGGDKTRATIIGKYVSGNVAVVQFEIRGGATQKAGVDRFIVWNIYEVKGDKIAAGTSALQRTDPQTARFIEWQQSQPPAR